MEDLQTPSLLFFGSHMAKTKPVLKKPSADKQFTAGHTNPATKLSKKPATKLSKLIQDASEVIGPRPPLKKRDDSPPPLNNGWPTYHTYTDAVAIAMDVNGVLAHQRHDGIFTCGITFSKVSASPKTIVLLKQIASMSATPMPASLYGDEASIRPLPDLPTNPDALSDYCSANSDMGYKSK